MEVVGKYDKMTPLLSYTEVPLALILFDIMISLVRTGQPPVAQMRQGEEEGVTEQDAQSWFVTKWTRRITCGGHL